MALPYAIVFQMKWRNRTAQDFSGEHADIEIKRIDKRMSTAAKQFREFLSLYDNHATIMLPRVWRQKEEEYELPLAYIEKIIPVVVIDFEDPDYIHPEQRTCLCPQVIDKNDALRKLYFASMLMYKLDEVERRKWISP